MSQRSDSPDISVENSSRGYTNTGAGPQQDTDALLATPPSHARSVYPIARREEPIPKHTDTPNFRAVVRPAAEVEKDRVRPAPPWLRPALFAGGALAVLGAVLFLVSSRLFPEAPPATPPADPAPAEAPLKNQDLRGIPVREGLGR